MTAAVANHSLLQRVHQNKSHQVLLSQKRRAQNVVIGCPYKSAPTPKKRTMYARANPVPMLCRSHNNSPLSRNRYRYKR